MRFDFLWISLVTGGLVFFLSPMAQGGTVSESTTKGSNKFAFSLYQKRSAPGQTKNILIGPYSISSALAMAYVGAKHDTAKEIGSVFGFPSDLETAKAFRDLNKNLIADQAKDGYQLEIANRLYGEKSLTFKPEFLKITAEDFGAPLQSVDFMHHAEDARNIINKWVSEKTHGKILEIIPQHGLNSRTRLVLVNAMYFFADWAEEFSPELTKNEPFTLTSGSSVQASMMHTLRRLPYYHDEALGVQVVKLGYKSKTSSATSFYLLLPDKTVTMTSIEGKWTSDLAAKFAGGMREHMVDLKLPRFRIDSGTMRLGSSLEAMGIKSAFSAKADFSGMLAKSDKAPLFLEQVLHKTYIKVDERGTEAAAATAAGVFGGASRPPKADYVVHANRPFLFLVQNDLTGSILFIGKLENPADK